MLQPGQLNLFLRRASVCDTEENPRRAMARASRPTGVPDAEPGAVVVAWGDDTAEAGTGKVQEAK